LELHLQHQEPTYVLASLVGSRVDDYDKGRGDLYSLAT